MWRQGKPPRHPDFRMMEAAKSPYFPIVIEDYVEDDVIDLTSIESNGESQTASLTTLEEDGSTIRTHTSHKYLARSHQQQQQQEQQQTQAPTMASPSAEAVESRQEDEDLPHKQTQLEKNMIYIDDLNQFFGDCEDVDDLRSNNSDDKGTTVPDSESPPTPVESVRSFIPTASFADAMMRRDTAWATTTQSPTMAAATDEPLVVFERAALYDDEDDQHHRSNSGNNAVGRTHFDSSHSPSFQDMLERTPSTGSVVRRFSNKLDEPSPPELTLSDTNHNTNQHQETPTISTTTPTPDSPTKKTLPADTSESPISYGSSIYMRAVRFRKIQNNRNKKTPTNGDDSPTAVSVDPIITIESQKSGETLGDSLSPVPTSTGTTTRDFFTFDTEESRLDLDERHNVIRVGDTEDNNDDNVLLETRRENNIKRELKSPISNNNNKSEDHFTSPRKESRNDNTISLLRSREDTPSDVMRRVEQAMQQQTTNTASVAQVGNVTDKPSPTMASWHHKLLKGPTWHAPTTAAAAQPKHYANHPTSKDDEERDVTAPVHFTASDSPSTLSPEVTGAVERQIDLTQAPSPVTPKRTAKEGRENDQPQKEVVSSEADFLAPPALNPGGLSSMLQSKPAEKSPRRKAAGAEKMASPRHHQKTFEGAKRTLWAKPWTSSFSLDTKQSMAQSPLVSLTSEAWRLSAGDAATEIVDRVTEAERRKESIQVPTTLWRKPQLEAKPVAQLSPQHEHQNDRSAMQQSGKQDENDGDDDDDDDDDVFPPEEQKDFDVDILEKLRSIDDGEDIHSLPKEPTININPSSTENEEEDSKEPTININPSSTENEEEDIAFQQQTIIHISSSIEQSFARIDREASAPKQNDETLPAETSATEAEDVTDGQEDCAPSQVKEVQQDDRDFFRAKEVQQVLEISDGMTPESDHVEKQREPDDAVDKQSMNIIEQKVQDPEEHIPPQQQPRIPTDAPVGAVATVLSSAESQIAESSSILLEVESNLSAVLETAKSIRPPREDPAPKVEMTERRLQILEKARALLSSPKKHGASVKKAIGASIGTATKSDPLASGMEPQYNTIRKESLVSVGPGGERTNDRAARGTSLPDPEEQRSTPLVNRMRERSAESNRKIEPRDPLASILAVKSEGNEGGCDDGDHAVVFERVHHSKSSDSQRPLPKLVQSPRSPDSQHHVHKLLQSPHSGNGSQSAGDEIVAFWNRNVDLPPTMLGNEAESASLRSDGLLQTEPPEIEKPRNDHRPTSPSFYQKLLNRSRSWKKDGEEPKGTNDRPESLSYHDQGSSKQREDASQQADSAESHSEHSVIGHAVHETHKGDGERVSPANIVWPDRPEAMKVADLATIVWPDRPSVIKSLQENLDQRRNEVIDHSDLEMERKGPDHSSEETFRTTLTTEATQSNSDVYPIVDLNDTTNDDAAKDIIDASTEVINVNAYETIRGKLMELSAADDEDEDDKLEFSSSEEDDHPSDNRNYNDQVDLSVPNVMEPNLSSTYQKDHTEAWNRADEDPRSEERTIIEPSTHHNHQKPAFSFERNATPQPPNIDTPVSSKISPIVAGTGHLLPSADVVMIEVGPEEAESQADNQRNRNPRTALRVETENILREIDTRDVSAHTGNDHLSPRFGDDHLYDTDASETRDTETRDTDTREETESKISLVSYLETDEESDLETNYESTTVPMIVRMLDQGCAWLESNQVCGLEAPSLLKESRGKPLVQGPGSRAAFGRRSLRKAKVPLVNKFASTASGRAIFKRRKDTASVAESTLASNSVRVDEAPMEEQDSRAPLDSVVSHYKGKTKKSMNSKDDEDVAIKIEADGWSYSDAEGANEKHGDSEAAVITLPTGGNDIQDDISDFQGDSRIQEIVGTQSGEMLPKISTEYLDTLQADDNEMTPLDEASRAYVSGSMGSFGSTESRPTRRSPRVSSMAAPGGKEPFGETIKEIESRSPKSTDSLKYSPSSSRRSPRARTSRDKTKSPKSVTADKSTSSAVDPPPQSPLSVGSSASSGHRSRSTKRGNHESPISVDSTYGLKHTDLSLPTSEAEKNQSPQDKRSRLNAFFDENPTRETSTRHAKLRTSSAESSSRNGHDAAGTLESPISAEEYRSSLPPESYRRSLAERSNKLRDKKSQNDGSWSSPARSRDRVAQLSDGIEDMPRSPKADVLLSVSKQKDPESPTKTASYVPSHKLKRSVSPSGSASLSPTSKSANSSRPLDLSLSPKTHSTGGNGELASLGSKISSSRSPRGDDDWLNGDADLENVIIFSKSESESIINLVSVDGSQHSGPRDSDRKARGNDLEYDLDSPTGNFHEKIQERIARVRRDQQEDNTSFSPKRKTKDPEETAAPASPSGSHRLLKATASEHSIPEGDELEQQPPRQNNSLEEPLTSYGTLSADLDGDKLSSQEMSPPSSTFSQSFETAGKPDPLPVRSSGGPESSLPARTTKSRKSGESKSRKSKSKSSRSSSSKNKKKGPPGIQAFLEMSNGGLAESQTDSELYMNLTEEERLAALELAERLRKRASTLKRRRKKREKRLKDLEEAEDEC